MKHRSLVLFCLLLLTCVAFSLAYSQRTGESMKPMTDGVLHTSGEKGKWVKGCPPRPCNMGVGNLGPKDTYHWVE
jgi:hypothetical protein